MGTKKLVQYLQRHRAPKPPNKKQNQQYTSSNATEAKNPPLCCYTAGEIHPLPAKAFKKPEPKPATQNETKGALPNEDMIRGPNTIHKINKTGFCGDLNPTSTIIT
jgi:hypothetical protein